jgi:hypothetical protein
MTLHMVRMGLRTGSCRAANCRHNTTCKLLVPAGIGVSIATILQTGSKSAAT